MTDDETLGYRVVATAADLDDVAEIIAGLPDWVDRAGVVVKVLRRVLRHEFDEWTPQSYIEFVSVYGREPTEYEIDEYGFETHWVPEPRKPPQPGDIAYEEHFIPPMPWVRPPPNVRYVGGAEIRLIPADTLRQIDEKNPS